MHKDPTWAKYIEAYLSQIRAGEDVDQIEVTSHGDPERSYIPGTAWHASDFTNKPGNKPGNVIISNTSDFHIGQLKIISEDELTKPDEPFRFNEGISKRKEG